MRAILLSGKLSSSKSEGGQHVQKFESAFTSYVRAKYAVAVNSGTSALQAALYTLDIKKGDEILLPSFTFVGTTNSVVSTGAKPVFVDILKQNYTMDPQDLRKKISKKCKAIIPVHLYGNLAYIKEISEIAKKHNLQIIEDAAQSLGSTYKGQHSGTFSDLGCFSLYPTKVITAGEGGIITTNDKRLASRLRMIRNQGIEGNNVKRFGLNFRLSEINAAIAKIQMKKITSYLIQRRRNAKFLSDLLSDLDIRIPHERKGEKVNWFVYTISTNNRDRIVRYLNSKGIGASVYYRIPVHKTSFYKQKVKLPNTDWASSHVLSLPVNPQITEQNLRQMSKFLHKMIK